MRPRIGLLLLVLLASAMTACGPGEVTTTTPPPPPTTQPPTPSPQWTPEEQGSIDAVQRYLEVWADIGHDPLTNKLGDVNSRYTVTASVTWNVTWSTTDGQYGTFTMDMTSTDNPTIHVGELYVVRVPDPTPRPSPTGPR